MNAYKARRPWITAVITLILSPFIGLLYLGRAALALLCLLANYLVLTGIVLIFPRLFPGASSQYGLGLVQLAINAASLGLVLPIARRDDSELRWPWYSRLPALLTFIAAINIAPYLVRAYLFRVFDVPSASMLPTLDIGDYFFVDMRAFNGRDPERGDLAIFKVRGTTFYVKRIVGVPGDRVQMSHGVLTINGSAARLKRAGTYAAICETPCSFPQYMETLPNGHGYFVLKGTEGNPNSDTDVFSVPPNSYFVLGDNRDNSEDSRNGLGFVQRQDLVGKPTYKFFNKFRQRWEWQSVR